MQVTPPLFRLEMNPQTSEQVSTSEEVVEVPPTAETVGQKPSRESEVVVKQLGEKRWTYIIDSKQSEDVFADRASAEAYVRTQFGVLTKTQSIKKASKQKPAKKESKKAPRNTSELNDSRNRTKERKPLSLHKHWLIDVRRHAPELGWSEDDWGRALNAKVRNSKGVKLLEISLV